MLVRSSLLGVCMAVRVEEGEGEERACACLRRGRGTGGDVCWKEGGEAYVEEGGEVEGREPCGERRARRGEQDRQ